jgi:hypothetical protein
MHQRFTRTETKEVLFAESYIQIVLPLSHMIVKSWMIVPLFTSCIVIMTFISVVSLP